MNVTKAPPALKEDRLYFEIAKAVSKGATCKRGSVGTILVKDRRVLTTGYNGAPSGQHECKDIGCKIVNNHCTRVIHSEVNAVTQAAIHGVGVKGAVAYVYFENHNPNSNYPAKSGTFSMEEFPCYSCWQVLVAAGVKSVLIRYSTGETARYEMKLREN